MVIAKLAGLAGLAKRLDKDPGGVKETTPAHLGYDGPGFGKRFRLNRNSLAHLARTEETVYI